MYLKNKLKTLVFCSMLIFSTMNVFAMTNSETSVSREVIKKKQNLIIIL